ncbi:capsid protein [bream circovirus 1]|uniref:Capsid protein n=1 Tax=bream circovirus 1 TaxID=3230612 RepID=A0AAU8BXZ4_9CIRC
MILYVSYRAGFRPKMAARKARSFRRRRPIRRRRRVVSRRRQHGVFHLRLIKQDQAVINANSFFGGAFSFKMADYLTSLSWDYYRINAAVVQFIPRVSPSFTSDANGGAICSAVLDYDDKVSPTTATSLMNQQGVRLWRNDRRFSIKWVPRVQIGLGYNNGTEVSASGIGRPRQWINSAYNQVEHYGLKFVLANNGDTTKLEWDVITKLYISLKRPLIGGSFASMTGRDLVALESTNHNEGIELAFMEGPEEGADELL